MKKFTLVLFAFFAALSINAQDSIAGIWNTGDDNTKVEITENDGAFYGKIISSENAEAKIGNQILKDVKFSKGEGKGKMYAAKKGKWYDAVLKEKENQLEVKIKVGVMKKTLKWKKE